VDDASAWSEASASSRSIVWTAAWNAHTTESLALQAAAKANLNQQGSTLRAAAETKRRGLKSQAMAARKNLDAERAEHTVCSTVIHV
jgi:hypothetical protein